MFVFVFSGCKVCGKRFFNKFHHREHYNVHSGETPYECEFCFKRFAQHSGWNRHMKLHHKYEVFHGSIPTTTYKFHNEITDENKPHKSCDDVTPELIKLQRIAEPVTSVVARRPPVLLVPTTNLLSPVGMRPVVPLLLESGATLSSGLPLLPPRPLRHLLVVPSSLPSSSSSAASSASSSSSFSGNNIPTRVVFAKVANIIPRMQ